MSSLYDPRFSILIPFASSLLFVVVFLVDLDMKVYNQIGSSAVFFSELFCCLTNELLFAWLVGQRATFHHLTSNTSSHVMAYLSTFTSYKGTLKLLVRLL